MAKQHAYGSAYLLRRSSFTTSPITRFWLCVTRNWNSWRIGSRERIGKWSYRHSARELGRPKKNRRRVEDRWSGVCTAARRLPAGHCFMRCASPVVTSLPFHGWRRLRRAAKFTSKHGFIAVTSTNCDIAFIFVVTRHECTTAQAERRRCRLTAHQCNGQTDAFIAEWVLWVRRR